MAIGTAADLATVLAVSTTFIGGLIWWFWIRPKRNRRIKADITRLQEHFKSLEASTQNLQAIIADGATDDFVRIGALITDVLNRLDAIRATTFMHFVRTHLHQDELPNIRFQSPITTQDKSE